MHSVSELFDFDAFPEVDFPKDGFIVICRARNEMLRLPFFLKHYRSIGAKHFFIIDNASEDETSEYLSGQPDVTVLFTSKPYKTLKNEWVFAALNHYCQDRWTLHADIDEQFVYPGWPDLKLDALLAYWERDGYEGVIAPLVDMYSDKPLSQINYAPEAPFLGTCPYFDTTTTWALPIDSQDTILDFEVRGGIRGRLFSHPSKRQLVFPFDLLQAFYLAPAKIKRHLPFKSFAQRRFARFLPKQAPLLTKIPLLTWRVQNAPSWKVYRATLQQKPAPDWCALLHFKFLQDFKKRVEEEVTRKSYYADGLEYQLYHKYVDRIIDRSPLYYGSRKFSSVEDLYRSNLAFCTDELKKYTSHLKAKPPEERPALSNYESSFSSNTR